MSTNLQRADDIRIEQILQKLDKIDIALNGNGHPGLIKDGEAMKVQVADIQSSYCSIKNWMSGSLLVIIMAMGSFVFSYGQLYKEVETLGVLVQGLISHFK